MLFFLKIFSQQYNTNEKKIDGKCNSGMLFYYFPCFFHFDAPMNIIKYEDGFVV